MDFAGDSLFNIDFGDYHPYDSLSDSTLRQLSIELASSKIHLLKDGPVIQKYITSINVTVNSAEVDICCKIVLQLMSDVPLKFLYLSLLHGNRRAT